MVATTAGLVGMFIALSAFSLSGQQVVERDLGRFASQAELGIATGSPPGDTRVAKAIAEAAERAGANEPTVMWTSFSVRPARTDGLVTVYLETNWTTTPFPERYTLAGGRWPVQAGEVVVTEGLRNVLGAVDSISIFSGNDRLRIVGVARDLFGRSSRILAADGTWAALSPATRRNFPTADAAPALYWNGGDQQRVVSAAVAAISAATPGGLRAEARMQVDQGVRTREVELALGRSTWLDRLPVAYQVPALILPLLSVLLIFGMNGRRLRRTLGILRSIGMSRAHTTAGIAVAVTAWTMVSTLLGGLVGVGLGLASRRISEQFLAGPISPFPALGLPLTRLVATTAASCLLAAVMLYLTGRAPRSHAELARIRTPSSGTPSRQRSFAVVARRLLAGVAACAAVVQVATLDTIPAAMFLAGTVAALVLLATPELVGAAIRWFPGSGPRSRLSRRQLAGDKGRAVAAVAVLAAVLGAPIGLLTLLATLVSTIAAEELPNVAPHQVVVATPAGFLHQPPQSVLQAISRRVDFAEPPIQVSYLRSATARVTVQGGGIRSLLAIDTTAETARLNNGPLTDIQTETLQDGGMLVWDDSGRAGQTLVVSDVTTDRIKSTVPIAASPADFQRSWTSSAVGLLLTSTAQRLGLPLTRGAVVYTNVPDDQAAIAKQATVDAGLDPGHVDIYQPPDPVTVPPPFYATIVGLGLVVLATTTAVVRTQVITLRRYLGRLISIGLPPRWAQHVLLMQGAAIVLVSTAAALFLAIPPVLITVLKLPDFTLSVPWSWLGLTIGTFYIAAAAATLLSSRRLRSADRLAD